MPQATHAPAIANARSQTPQGRPGRIGERRRRGWRARRATACDSTFSFKTIQTMAIVARPSRSSSNAADESGVRTKPTISKSGPTTPPARTTKPSQGRSARRRGASGAGTPRIPRLRCMKPEPRYSNPASSHASTPSPSNSFAKGVEARTARLTRAPSERQPKGLMVSFFPAY
jgi:hypothetical protein